ncbi:MAG TPA: hypothetical protein VKZ97_01320, partial [Flavobacteriaceae bacterium]|nr:hypothetical protein [Flavobacteriaceae bacterium]
MNSIKLNSKSILSLLVFGILLAPINADAQKKDKKKKKDDKEVVQQPKKDAKKSIDELTKSSKKLEGLFTIYQDTVNASTQIVISEDQIGKEFIYFSQIADGVTDVGRNRGSYRGSKVFKIKKYFDRIEFETQNTSFYFDPNNPLSKSKDANISHSILASLKIETHDEKNGLYLLKA